MNLTQLELKISEYKILCKLSCNYQSVIEILTSNNSKFNFESFVYSQDGDSRSVYLDSKFSIPKSIILSGLHVALKNVIIEKRRLEVEFKSYNIDL